MRSIARKLGITLRSDWYRGLLWAEERVREVGHRATWDELDGCAVYFTDFDQGAKDYLHFYQTELGGVRNECRSAF